MDPNRLRVLLAAPLASLFLVLSLCAFVVQKPASVGIHLPMERAQIDPTRHCEVLDGTVSLVLHKDGSAWLNNITPFSASELGPKLSEIYAPRFEKLIFLYPDSEISFGDFAKVYNIVSSSTNDLHIYLTSPQLDEEFDTCPLGKTCGLEWPDGFCVFAVTFPLKPIRIRR
jgi:biopolymer transport protein ExbD